MTSETDGIVVEVKSQRFGPETDRGKAAAAELLADLKREFGDDLPEPPPRAGFKGDPITVGAIVIALISSGAVGKAIDVVKGWIEKDPEDRTLELHGNVNGKQVDLVVSGRNLSDETLAQTIQQTFAAADGD